MGARIQLTISLYADFERQFQGMRAEHRVLLGRLQEAKRTLTDLPSAEIPETEVLVALNTNPMYRDLTSRLGFLEQMKRIHEHAALPGTKDPPAYMRTKADYDSTKTSSTSWSRSRATWSACQADRPGVGDQAPGKPGGRVDRANDDLRERSREEAQRGGSGGPQFGGGGDAPAARSRTSKRSFAA